MAKFNFANARPMAQNSPEMQNARNNNYGQGNFQNQYNQRPVKKHSGASKGTDKNGKQYFRGWNYSAARGMVTVFVSAYAKSGEHTSSKSNVTYTNLLAKVEYKNSGVVRLMGALLSHTTNRVTIPELGMVLNPGAPNGGYFGKFSK
jgi:hypothetical protein